MSKITAEVANIFDTLLDMREVDGKKITGEEVIYALKSEGFRIFKTNYDAVLSFEGVVPLFAVLEEEIKRAVEEECQSCALLALDMDPEALKCSNAHDRCDGEIGYEGCPYCERDSEIANAIAARHKLWEE